MNVIIAWYHVFGVTWLSNRVLLKVVCRSYFIASAFFYRILWVYHLPLGICFFYTFNCFSYFIDLYFFYKWIVLYISYFRNYVFQKKILSFLICVCFVYRVWKYFLHSFRIFEFVVKSFPCPFCIHVMCCFFFSCMKKYFVGFSSFKIIFFFAFYYSALGIIVFNFF